MMLTLRRLVPNVKALADLLNNYNRKTDASARLPLPVSQSQNAFFVPPATDKTQESNYNVTYDVAIRAVIGKNAKPKKPESYDNEFLVHALPPSVSYRSR